MMSSNHSHDHPGGGAEALSALFDGELQGDAARFAMKRLAHDPQWQRSFGNWQVFGDALRGHVGSVAPGDFAARVSAAVAAESVLPIAPADAVAPALVPGAVATPARARAPRTWIGGAALAASVAVVAMLVARPFSPDGADALPAPPAPTELVAAPPPASAAPARKEPLLAAVVPLPGDVAIVAGEVPRRPGDRRSRGPGQRAAQRASGRQAPTATVARAGAIGEPAPVRGDPFGPPPVEVVARPWPRAVLPATGAGAFTASFHGVAASTPSFYPFEPRLPNAGDAAPVPANGSDRR